MGYAERSITAATSLRLAYTSAYVESFEIPISRRTRVLGRRTIVRLRENNCSEPGTGWRRTGVLRWEWGRLAHSLPHPNRLLQ